MTNGIKFDSGKLDFTLLPYEAIQEVVKVLMYGAKKYPEADNWKRVEDPRKRYNRAALRHLFSEVNGETMDSESNLYHLAHTVCSNLFALHFAIQEKNKENKIEKIKEPKCAYITCKETKNLKQYYVFGIQADYTILCEKHGELLQHG